MPVSSTNQHMRTNKILLSTLACSLVLGFSACKKDAKDNDLDKTGMSVHADDQSRVSAEIDAVANDASLILEGNAGFSGRFETVNGIICDANVTVNTTTNPMTLTVVYDGTNCLGNRTRTGTVILSMAQGTHWKDTGAAVTVTFQDLKVTRVSDNKSITLNGSQAYTNVSGGLILNLANPQSSITHSITSDGLSVTFDDGSQRTWKIAKQRVFTYSGRVVISTTGTHSENNITGIAEWGTNRFGQAFTTSVTDPIVLKQDCNFRVTGGAVKHTLPNASATVTFGLNSNGMPTGCPGSGHYYYKLMVTGPNGNSIGLILPY